MGPAHGCPGQSACMVCRTISSGETTARRLCRRRERLRSRARRPDCRRCRSRAADHGTGRDRARTARDSVRVRDAPRRREPGHQALERATDQRVERLGRRPVTIGLGPGDAGRESASAVGRLLPLVRGAARRAGHRCHRRRARRQSAPRHRVQRFTRLDAHEQHPRRLRPVRVVARRRRLPLGWKAGPVRDKKSRRSRSGAETDR